MDARPDPDLYQTDPAWADAPYAGGTVGENGCGPTCMTAAYVAQTEGPTWTPPRWRRSRSARLRRVQHDHLAFHERRGASARPSIRGASRRRARPQGGARAGQNRHLQRGAGDFTTQGHFIVVRGVDDEGKLRVMDPNSAERTALAWSAERVIGQCLNIWAVSA